MKKLLLIALFSTLCHFAKAQIQVQEEYTNDLVIIGNISGGAFLNAMAGTSSGKAPEHRLYCRMFAEKITFGILIDTSNRFDDDFEFALGTSIPKAIESIRSIQNLMKTKPLKTSINVVDEDGRTVQITIATKNSISMKVLGGDNAVIVSNVMLTNGNLDRAIKLLETKAEKVVNKKLDKNVEHIEMDESEMIYL